MKLLLLALFIFTGCSDHGEKVSSQKSQVLKLNIYTEPPTLDPGRTTDTTSANILHLLFEGLVRYGPEDSPQPAVAEEIAISPDGKTYTFTLRATQWNNGEPVTAHDFAYAWGRTLDPTFPADMAYDLYLIKNGKKVKEGKLPKESLGVHAVDDRTLVVELEHPTPYFLDKLTGHMFLPLHQKTVESNPDWAYEAGPAYVSNGPFRMTLWKHNNEVVVEKSPSYWDNESVKLNQIVLSMIEDVNTELSLFEKGELDWAGKPISIGLPTDAIPALEKSGRLHKKPYAATYNYAFNTRRKPFNNANFRKALAFAIHRNEITENILQGGEPIATGLTSPPMQLQKEPYFQDHNVKEAQRLFSIALKELNITPSQLPKIRLSYNTSEAHHKVAQAIQQQWRSALGLEVTLENAEWKVYLDNLSQGNFDIARMTWHSGVNDAISFLELYKDVDGRMNHTGWSNPKYTALLVEADETNDSQKRQDLLHQAETLIMSEMPMIPLYYLTSTYLINPALRDVYFSPMGEVDFKRAYFQP